MATILESKNDIKMKPMTDTERELVHMLRVMLKDLPDDIFRSLNTLVEEQRGERWTDMQLLVYIHQTIADINSEAPLTDFTVDNFPPGLKAGILNGAVVFALIAEGIMQIGEHFAYSDNGISLSIDLASKYQSMAQMLKQSYEEWRRKVKLSMRPFASSVKSNPAPVRVRSYAPRQWVYR